MDEKLAQLLRKWEVRAQADGSVRAWKSLATVLLFLPRSEKVSVEDEMINAELANTGIRFGIVMREERDGGVRFEAHS